MKKGYLAALIVLGLLTLLSLALNVTVVLGLLRFRAIAANTLSEARAIIAEIGDDTLSYTVQVDQEIPVAASIPFSEQVAVPINTTVPISTTVVVPVNLGIATYRLSVPISTVFPVDLEVSVPVSQTVDIATAVPLDVDVPVEIPVAETPVSGYLQELDATLAKIETQLERPFGKGD